MIEKDCKNEEYKDLLERNIIKSKIRNMFDVEFNKKFEGAISIPIQTRSQSVAMGQPEQHQSSRQQALNSISSTGPNANKFLFFITDKFEAETKTEEEERRKLKRKLDVERMEVLDRNRLKRQKVNGFPSSSRSLLSPQYPTGNKPSKGKTSLTDHPMNGDEAGPRNLGREASIDEELEELERIYEETQQRIKFDMSQLKKKVVAHKEPPAVSILESLISQERTYLQNQIIQIEMKQIAESITRVTHAKKVSATVERKQSFADMVLEKYGPPIVRKTRQMASMQQQTGKKSAGVPTQKLLSQDKQDGSNSVQRMS